MNKYFILILSLFISININAQIISKTQNEKIINKQYITIGYNLQYKIPNYVIEILTPKMLIGNVSRESDFYSELSIYPYWYNKSGYDKGHMAPAADFKFSKIGMHDSFSILNVAPQNPYFNRHTWLKLENNIRKIVNYCDTLYVITGTIIKPPYNYIDNKILIPNKFYKAIIGKYRGDFRYSCCWIYNNDNTKTQTIENTKYSIDYLEKNINRNLFININNEKIEKQIIYFK